MVTWQLDAASRARGLGSRAVVDLERKIDPGDVLAGGGEVLGADHDPAARIADEPLRELAQRRRT
jgi:hypothetical protein